MNHTDACSGVPGVCHKKMLTCCSKFMVCAYVLWPYAQGNTGIFASQLHENGFPMNTT